MIWMSLLRVLFWNSAKGSGSTVARSDGGFRHIADTRCRSGVITVDPGTGLLGPSEQPGDILNGIASGVGLGTILAEFESVDRLPGEKIYVGLLDATVATLAEHPLD